MTARKYATFEDLATVNSKLDAMFALLTAKPESLPEAPRVEPAKVEPAKASKGKGKAKGKGVTATDGDVPVKFETWDTIAVRPRDGSLWVYISPEVDIAKATPVLFAALSKYGWYATVNGKGEVARKRSTKFYPHYEDGKLQYWHAHAGLIDKVNQPELRAALTIAKPKLVKYVKTEVKTEVKTDLSFAI